MSALPRYARGTGVGAASGTGALGGGGRRGAEPTGPAHSTARPTRLRKARGRVSRAARVLRRVQHAPPSPRRFLFSFFSRLFLASARASALSRSPARGSRGDGPRGMRRRGAVGPTARGRGTRPTGCAALGWPRTTQARREREERSAAAAPRARAERPARAYKRGRTVRKHSGRRSANSGLPYVMHFSLARDRATRLRPSAPGRGAPSAGPEDPGERGFRDAWAYKN